MTSVKQQKEAQPFNRIVKVPVRARRYQEEELPLHSYIMRGAGGMAFMMFIFWLAGFGS